MSTRSERLRHYQIRRRLGEGAHGIVYLAHDERLLRPVVLKRLRRRLFSAARERERILREARMASAIDHPNVCAIYEIHDEPGEVFLAMQYVPGRPLKEILGEDRLSVPFTLSVATQIADGLAAAHDLGVIHRDLKPANIMVGHGGLVKLLDFGLARRNPEGAAAGDAEESPAEPSARSSEPEGALGFMAPEQFFGDPATPQTDLFAVGVLLYMMLIGEHPFAAGRADPLEIARASQFHRPSPLAARRPDVPGDLERVVVKALAKDPAERYRSASELRDALSAVGAAADGGAGLGVPRVAPDRAAPERRSGLWSMLRAFLSDDKEAAEPGSVAVLPFESAERPETVAAHGFAIANAIATKLARLPGVTVRPTPSLLSARDLPAEPAHAGRSLGVSHVVSGTCARDGERLSIGWQLVGVARDEVLTGDSMVLYDLDLATAQTSVSDQIFGALRGAAQIPGASAADSDTDPPAAVAESYFEARARLSTFMMRSHRRKDLDGALAKLRGVAEAAPAFAHVHAALGIAHVQYARCGFGGLEHIRTATRALDRCLELDPDHVEAKAFRVYALISLGEKESAREGVRHLLEVAPTSSHVRLVAATLLRLDGAYDEAMRQLAEALRHSPDDAHLVYNQRARIFHYRGELAAARAAIDKALELQPRHSLLRTTDGYLRLREHDPAGAAAILEEVVEDDPTLQLAYPTLAIAKWLAGERAAARALISEQTLAAARCDADAAYRVATFYAVARDVDPALGWLRRAIHLGNENYPWLAENPAWAELRDHPDCAAVLSRLRDRYQRNLARWRALLPESRAPARAGVPSRT